MIGHLNDVEKTSKTYYPFLTSLILNTFHAHSSRETNSQICETNSYICLYHAEKKPFNVGLSAREFTVKGPKKHWSRNSWMFNIRQRNSRRMMYDVSACYLCHFAWYEVWARGCNVISRHPLSTYFFSFYSGSVFQLEKHWHTFIDYWTGWQKFERFETKKKLPIKM
jgi:hypothetical protein